MYVCQIVEPHMANLSYPYNNSTIDQQMSLDYNALQSEDIVKAIYSALSGNNELIQEATTFLRTYVKFTNSLRTLADILVTHQDQSVRLYCTVLLRRKFIVHFQNIPQEEQNKFKNMLLVQFGKEKSFLIQKNIAGLIGRLIPVVDLANWSELQTLFQQTIQANPNSKLTLVLLNELIGQFKLPHTILEYMLKCLIVQQLTEHALHCVLSYVATENSIDDAIPKAVIEAWNVGKWEEDNTLLALEIFCELALKKSQLKQEYIQWVCEKTVKDTQASNNVRVSGLDFLKDLAENTFKNKALNTNQQLLKYVVEVICIVVCQPPTIETVEEGQAVQDIALWLVQTYSLILKQKKFYPIIFDAITSLINSNDPNKMNAGFLILASISEGCAERLKKNLTNPIMNVLIPKGLQSQSPEVRGAAINTLIFFSEFLSPNILDYHGVIVPSMVMYMNDSIQKVGEKALIALDILFDNMDQEQIVEYLPSVVPIMHKIWIAPTASLTMKKASLSAIGSLISASEVKFEPYIQTAYELAIQSLKLPDTPEGLQLKTEGITILGRLAFQFTKDTCRIKKDFFTSKIFPLLEPLYNTLVSSKDPSIRESCFSFFYLLASSIGEEFSHIFDKIATEVIKACEHDPGLPCADQNKFSLDEDSEPEDGYRMMKVKLPELDEKSAAIHALGEIAKACPKNFIPFFESAYKILEANYQHFHDNIRIQCVNCYENLTFALIKSRFEGRVPQYKQGIPCTDRYPESLETHFNQQLLPRLLFLMTEDHCAQVSACAIEALNNLSKEIGPALIDRKIDQISEAIIALLEGKDQFVDDDDEEQEDEIQEDDQTNETVFTPLCDFIPTLAKVLRVGFEPNFKAIFPSMMKYMQQDRENVNDYIQMVGSLAQIFHYMPSAIRQFQAEVLPRINVLRAMNDEQLNRNICYCLGVMYEGSAESMSPFLTGGMSELKNLYQGSISPATKENALSALARIIMVYNPQLPLDILLATIIGSMPFKADQSQQKTIWRLILHLSNTNGDILRPHISSILTLLQHDMADQKKYHLNKEPINSQLVQFGNNLHAMVNT